MKTRHQILKRINELNKYIHDTENDGWGGMSCMHNPTYDMECTERDTLEWVLGGNYFPCVFVCPYMFYSV